IGRSDLPILKDHDTRQVAGFTEALKVTKRGLEAQGVILTDTDAGQEIAKLETGYRIGRVLVYREALKQAPAGFSAATKCFCTEHQQQVADFAASVLGMEAVADSYFNRAIAYGPAYTIMGGTSDIMRNILGERVLGLPREPRP
ncbi:MAG: acyl-CoA dehydrogenase family protein, partial [Actinomycetota bacterium]